MAAHRLSTITGGAGRGPPDTLGGTHDGRALALAHELGVGADLAAAFDAILDDGGLPDLASLRVRFTPEAPPAPSVHIEMPSASAYDLLLAGRYQAIAA